jgi:hypothetical protein
MMLDLLSDVVVAALLNESRGHLLIPRSLLELEFTVLGGLYQVQSNIRLQDLLH